MADKVKKRKISRIRKTSSRRKNTLFKKAYEFGKLYEADVAVIVCKNGRFSVYRSMDQIVSA